MYLLKGRGGLVGGVSVAVFVGPAFGFAAGGGAGEGGRGRELDYPRVNDLWGSQGFNYIPYGWMLSTRRHQAIDLRLQCTGADQQQEPIHVLVPSTTEMSVDIIERKCSAGFLFDDLLSDLNCQTHRCE